VSDGPRVGLGFDVHRRSPPGSGRDLRLGGVLFAAEDGLEAHSDGDPVCHAVADAMLGSAALGDVGEHFPDSDPETSGIAGLDLLSRAVKLVKAAGLAPASVDVTLVCEHPAIAPRRDEIRACLATALDLPLDRVSVKATRPEGLGLSGDGIGCLAVAVLA